MFKTVLKFYQKQKLRYKTNEDFFIKASHKHHMIQVLFYISVGFVYNETLIIMYIHNYNAENRS